MKKDYYNDFIKSKLIENILKKYPQKTENKNIQSYDELPVYIHDGLEVIDNVFREQVLDFGTVVQNEIHPNFDSRFIMEVEFLCERKTLENSRILWCVRENSFGQLEILGLGKDPLLEMV